MTPPPPVDNTTVLTVLHYICPPSQLSTCPLPPHLISPPLRQRHHFLNLSPDDPVSYLAWPDTDAQNAFCLLECFQKPADEDIRFHIRYSTDPESSYAHIRITPDIRIIFYWDSSISEWKYHNLALMPFPTATFEYSDNGFLQDRSPTVTLDEDEDDLYWNAYGRADDDGNPPILDDAYWAQYATVQGSGDSTLPSPLPAKRKLVQPSEHVEDPSVFSYSSHPSEIYNPLEPPSPTTLCRRLELIPSRSASPPLLTDDSASGSGTYSATPSPPTQSADFSSVSGFDQESAQTCAGENDDVVKNTIKGIYRLWQMGRTKSLDDQEVFSNIVREAISEPA
ncbi:hypothetical protein BD779DRAFT_1485203 [Infundibulicybe gibba]|nr:hypothetical protein BD779DRAFT_1485203 [Infundibulicybe gibba]